MANRTEKQWRISENMSRFVIEEQTQVINNHEKNFKLISNQGDLYQTQNEILFHVYQTSKNQKFFEQVLMRMCNSETSKIL